MKTFLFTYSGAVFLAMIFTPLVIFIAKSLNIYDTQNARKVHAGDIPRLGGVAIFLAMMGVMVPILLLNNVIGDAFRNIQKQIIALLVGGTFIFFFGFIDDLCHLRARTKLLAQLIAAIGVCSFGIRIDSITVSDWLSIEFGWFAWPLTILWIAGVTNAINLIDGLDGLAAGISAIACGVIAILSFYTGQVIMTVLMLALLGSLTGFLAFNFNPARIFMGDCGSLFLGFMLASSSVLCASKTTTIVGLALPFLALGVPIFDMLFSILRRVLERRSIFSPDRCHIHHRLVDLGLHHRHVVIFIYLVTLITTGLGMFMMITRNIGTILVFAFVTLMVVAFFRIVGVVRLRNTIARLKRNLQISQFKKVDNRKFDNEILLIQNAKTFDEWWQATCTAAKEMDFAYLAIELKNSSGSSRTLVWRNSNYKPEFEDIIQVNLPVRQHRADQPLRLDLAVAVNGSLESSGYRIALFTRLIDEYSIANLPIALSRIGSTRTGKPIQSRIGYSLPGYIDLGKNGANV